MADIKLSDLDPATSVAKTDLVEISQDQGSSFTSKKVEFNNFVASVDKSEPNTVHVSKDGNDSTADGSVAYPFLTIKAALASITDNDATHRYNVSVDVGIYTENNPISMKSYVSIVSQGQFTQIEALNNSVNLIEMADLSDIQGFSLVGPLTAGAALYSNTAIGLSQALDITFINCFNGIHVDNASSTVTIEHTIAFTTGTESIDTLYNVTAGSLILNSNSVSKGSEVGTILNIDGATSSALGSTLTAESGDFINGIIIDNGARCTFSDVKFADAPLVTSVMEYGLSLDNGSTCHISGLSVAFSDVGVFMDNASSLTALSVSLYQCNSAVHIGTTGATELNVVSGSIRQSTNYDLIVESPDANVNGMGVVVNDAKVDINSDASLYSLELDDTEGDEGFNIRGELHVGSPEFPTESVFGEGDSYARGMLVYTYDNGTTTFTDVSEEASSVSGSTFGFTGVDINDAIYVASDRHNSDYLPHYGIKALMATAAVADIGDIVCEYWDGTSWSDVHTMSTESGGAYLPYAGALFVRTGSEQIRYDNGLVTDGWSKNDPIVPATGTDRYWVRYRLTTGITTAPIFQQFKLHTNRYEINADGFSEYFGSARPRASLGWSVADIRPAASAISNADIWYSDNLDVGMEENNMTSGDRVSFHDAMPADMDTSTPVKFRVAFHASSTGTYNYTIRWTFANPNSTVYLSNVAPATHPNEKSIVGSVSATAGEIIWIEEDIEYSGAIGRRDGGFGDILVVGLEANTIPGNMVLMVVDGKYTKWNEGEHV